MKIAIAASEAAPFSKTGGLGDVIQALPEALSSIPNNEVYVFLPYYGKMKRDSRWDCEFLTSFSINLAWRSCYVGLYRLKTKRKKLHFYFIDNEQYFDRDTIYGQTDDGERFAFFSKAILASMAWLGFRADVLHCNDWQTALVPVILNAEYRHVFPDTKTVFTIHNIEYQGWASLNFNFDVLGLPGEYTEILRYGEASNFMKAAIMSADAVSTVSETYAGELQYPYFSHGMSGILSMRSEDFYGITNGIDIHVFNPKTTAGIPYNFDAKTMTEEKPKNKQALQQELGLQEDAEAPLFAIVSRLAGHKGVDILCYIVHALMARKAQLAVVGTGEAQYEQALTALAAQYPGQMAVRLAFDPNLANRVYAGADGYLMPSKSEPCGLSQLIAMHFGTIPVVHATGGLRDTVLPYNPETGEGRGFTFQSYNGEDFMDAIDRAIRLYRDDRAAWNKLAAKDMQLDVSWKTPANTYMEMFYRVINK